MQLSVIIVNYNVCHFLEQCLHSLHAALDGIQAEVWVVDNASTDNSVSKLKPHFPWVHWVESAENLGFSRANNLALARSAGEYVLFLNPDTLLPEDCLHQCLSFLEKEKEAGALGIRMVDGGGHYLPESKRGYPGPLTSFFKLTGFTALFPSSRLFARYYLGHLSDRQSHPVEVLSGAFMLVRRQVLSVTGGFDERYFMYGEDIDLSFEINNTPIPGSNSNWKTWYFAGSTIIHFKGESTQKTSLRHVHTFYKAMLLFVKKHYSPLRAFVFGMFIYLAMAIRMLAGVFSRRTGSDYSEGPVWVATHPTDREDMQTIFSGIEGPGDISGWLIPAGATHFSGQTVHDWYKKEDLPSGSTLIFCAGSHFGLKEILSYMRPGTGIRYFFHYKGSSAIVGSSRGHLQGRVIKKG